MIKFESKCHSIKQVNPASDQHNLFKIGSSFSTLAPSRMAKIQDQDFSRHTEL